MVKTTLLPFLPLAVPLACAFSFTVESTPSQCSNLTLSWSGGTPPYEITILPTSFGSFDSIVDANISSTSWSEQLLFSENSEFVIVLSDATGFGTGGTSNVFTVGPGTSTCLPHTSPTIPQFFFPQPPTQCQDMTFMFPAFKTRPAVISAVIPGGSSFEFPLISGASTTASFPIDVKQGTKVAFMMGNSANRGAAGSSPFVVVGGGTDTSCLSNTSLSSTATSTSTMSSSSSTTVSQLRTTTSSSSAALNTSAASSSSSSSTITFSPAVIGGVVGGSVVALLLLGLGLFVLYRRRRSRVDEDNWQVYSVSGLGQTKKLTLGGVEQGDGDSFVSGGEEKESSRIGSPTAL